MSDRKLFDKRELLLIIPLALIAAAVAVFSGLFSSDGEYAVIEIMGQEENRIAMSTLSEPEIIEIHGEYELTIEIGPDYARVLESSCPDGTCVRTGRISKTGQSAICLPAQVAVKLVGGEGFDGETY